MGSRPNECMCNLPIKYIYISKLLEEERLTFILTFIVTSNIQYMQKYSAKNDMLHITYLPIP